jgi:hypothetical protein
MTGPFMEVAEERKKAVMPAIRREQPELHSPIDMLSRVATNLRIPSEGTYSNMGEAGLMSRIAANVQSFMQEGSVPLHTRFARMLESV